MILLQLGINQVYLTISEMNTFNNPTYYIYITDETTKEVKKVTLLDTSTNAIRYNQFAITVVDDILTEDLANGIVYLNAGKHTYVFTTEPTPAAPGAQEICEYGIVKVTKPESTRNVTYTDGVAAPVYKSYTGNINQSI